MKSWLVHIYKLDDGEIRASTTVYMTVPKIGAVRVHNRGLKAKIRDERIMINEAALEAFEKGKKSASI